MFPDRKSSPLTSRLKARDCSRVTRAEKYEYATSCIKDWITLANSGHVDLVEQPVNVRMVKPAH